MIEIEKLLSEHPTLMVSKKGCRYCDSAMHLFKENKIDPYIIQIDDYPLVERDGIMKELRFKWKHSTFPAIFFNGNYKGGYDDFKAYFNEKENIENKK